MNVLQALVLGLVQGLTEFLPVSSSGHLVIFSNILKITIEDGTTFSIFLHLATLISVIVVYFKDVCELVREFFGMIFDLFRGRFSVKSPYRKMMIMLIIATIPTVIMGLIFKKFGLDTSLSTLLVVGIMLLFTSLLMFIIDRIPQGIKGAKNGTFVDAVLVGLVQAAALMPGLSRSGSTITAGRVRGFNKEFAIKFSFLMSIPAILGAVVLESIDLIGEGKFNIDWLPFLAGFIAAAVSGILAIKFLITLLNKQKFYVFGIYCGIAGLTAIVFSFI